MNEPCLLFLHLHDQFNAAGVQDTFAVFAAVQPKEVLHPLSGGNGDPAQAPDGLDHLLIAGVQDVAGVAGIPFNRQIGARLDISQNDFLLALSHCVAAPVVAQGERPTQ